MKRRLRGILKHNSKLPSTKSKHFRFFALPAEIRHKVFDYLVPRIGETTSIIKWDLGIGPSANGSSYEKFQRAYLKHYKRLPCKSYLLISRRMRNELLAYALTNARLAVKFFVDAERPPLLSDRILSRTLAKHIRRCKLEFSYNNLLGKLKRGYTPEQLHTREDRISCHMGIAINSAIRQMPVLEVCHYLLTPNFEFAFTVHHDYILAACAHSMDRSCLTELAPARVRRDSVFDGLVRLQSEKLSLRRSVSARSANEDFEQANSINF